MQDYLKVYGPAYYKANKAEVNRKVVAINRRRRHDRYGEIRALKEMPCADCGQSFPYYVMDFDHRDPSEKIRDVSAMLKSKVTWSTVLAEIAKCDLVCANCHRLRTYRGDTSYRTLRHKFHRAVLDKLKASTPCLDCGKAYQPCQLDFDHKDSRGKVANIAQLVDSPTETLLEEIQKCHLVCANCHRIRGETNLRPNQGVDLVAAFRSIAAETPYPDDLRFNAFADIALLGTMPDTLLAKQVGISKEMIGWYRRRLNIPAYRKPSVEAGLMETA